MARHDEVCARWVSVVTGQATRMLTGARIFARDDRLYSYGSHFELARALRDKKGKAYGFLLNGDTYSVSTSKHQREIRHAVERSGLPSVIIPHSALTSANVEFDSVRIVEALADRHEITHEPRAERDPSWIESGGDLVTRTWDRVMSRPDGTYVIERQRHILGEALIYAESHERRTRKCGTCKGAAEVDGDPCRACVDTAYRDGGWVRVPTGQERYRHVRKVHLLSGFDNQDGTYFLCEMPHRKSRTVAEAYEHLKPDTVRAAELMGRPVLRQGDVFAVPVETLDKRALRKMGATFEKAGKVFGTNHYATEVAYLKDGLTLMRGTLRHQPVGRRPDHRRVTMPGNTWHVAVKNTVPLAGRR